MNPAALLAYIPLATKITELFVEAVHLRHVEGMTPEGARILGASATARVRRAQALARGNAPR